MKLIRSTNAQNFSDHGHQRGEEKAAEAPERGDEPDRPAAEEVKGPEEDWRGGARHFF
jgi:hypothetical protein